MRVICLVVLKSGCHFVLLQEEELIDIIEKAREMDEKYGHYFGN